MVGGPSPAASSLLFLLVLERGYNYFLKYFIFKNILK
jgi:hypothetical protein